MDSCGIIGVTANNKTPRGGNLRGHGTRTLEVRMHHKSTLLSPTQVERFWSQVDKSGDCWIWTGLRFTSGYGRFTRRAYRTHRVAWELTNGPIPEGLYVCHQCDNPPCCNPAHLFLGSPADNMADMVAKGRQTRGVDAPKARLTSPQVLVVKAAYESGHVSYDDLAEAFGVTKSSVYAIVKGKSWRWLGA